MHKKWYRTKLLTLSAFPNYFFKLTAGNLCDTSGNGRYKDIQTDVMDKVVIFLA